MGLLPLFSVTVTLLCKTAKTSMTGGPPTAAHREGLKSDGLKANSTLCFTFLVPTVSTDLITNPI